MEHVAVPAGSMTTGSPLVWDLADGDGGIDVLGGKGASLARLTAAGLLVPPGFCITTEAYRAYAATGATMPDAVAQAVLAAYARLGSPAVAVRSSATAEDLPDASFAGQQDTFLNVSGDAALLEAVRGCWCSLGTERAVAYRARLGIDEDRLAMAVVVQELVDADAAGIAFSVDPVTGDATRIMINSAWGLGEAVVGGQVSPDVFTIDRATSQLVDAAISDKLIMTRRTADGVVAGPVPEEQRSLPSITTEQAERLGSLCAQVSDLYSMPVDIEWCRRGEALFLLQARPITTVAPPRASGPDLWNDSRSGDFLWTDTNVGEAIPDVMTPATWSMVQVFLTDAMATASIPPYVGYGRIGGRIYLNVSVMLALSRAVGVTERRFRALTEEVFGRLPTDLEIPPVPMHRLRVIRSVLPMAAHVVAEARRDVRRLDTYLADHPQRCERRRAEIAAVASGPELSELWAHVLSPEFHQVSLMLSAATRSSGARFVTTRQRLQGLVGEAAANALTAGLGSTAGRLASLGLLDGLDMLAEGQIDRATFAARFGHRGPHEFEISRPRPGEDPDWIDRQLHERAGAGVTHHDLMGRQEQARDAAWAELRRHHPWQSRLLRHQLAGWAKISRDRERARDEVIRYFWVLRAYCLRAGELTGLGSDIFFLEAPEIVRALAGETISPDLIAERKAAYHGYGSLPSLPGLIRGQFDPYAWAADPHRRSDLVGAGERPAGDGLVRGFPGSAGVVEASVRVLTGAEDGGQLQEGEVLVTKITNVGWTPLFPRAAAVVTDVGAPLSHAAIVARELGLPAVVGCGDATMRLKTGDRVRVDGTAGTVEILP